MLQRHFTLPNAIIASFILFIDVSIRITNIAFEKPLLGPFWLGVFIVYTIFNWLCVAISSYNNENQYKAVNVITFIMTVVITLFYFLFSFIDIREVRVQAFFEGILFIPIIILFIKDKIIGVRYYKKGVIKWG